MIKCFMPNSHHRRQQKRRDKTVLSCLRCELGFSQFNIPGIQCCLQHCASDAVYLSTHVPSSTF